MLTTDHIYLDPRPTLLLSRGSLTAAIVGCDRPTPLAASLPIAGLENLDIILGSWKQLMHTPPSTITESEAHSSDLTNSSPPTWIWAMSSNCDDTHVARCTALHCCCDDIGCDITGASFEFMTVPKETVLTHQLSLLMPSSPSSRTSQNCVLQDVIAACPTAATAMTMHAFVKHSQLHALFRAWSV